mgnify:CR=1 FL=1
MLLVAPVQEKIRQQTSEEEQQLFGIDRLNVVRSEIPAVTHVDYSARVQTVSETEHPRYYGLMAPVTADQYRLVDLTDVVGYELKIWRYQPQ